MSHTLVRAHGITVEVDVPVPGWRSAESSGSDVWRTTVAIDSPAMQLGHQPAPGRVTWHWDDTSWPDRVSVELHGGSAPGSIRFVVDRVARRIDVDGTGAVNLDGCLELLGKWILPDLARHDLGAVPLHSTAVLTNVGALVVAGESGHGKSSLTAALCSAGALLIADEPTCIVPSASGSVVLPGIGVLRLAPEAAGRLAADHGDRWVDVSGGGDDAGKLLLVDTTADGAMHDRPGPVVAAIVVLGARRPDGPTITIERLTPEAAFRALFGQRYTRILEERNVRRDFDVLARLVASTTVLSVGLVDDLGELPGAAHRLLAEVVDIGR
ncbi:MAG: hypothetical protein RLZZ01_1939 [Actinomycetota bacterium]